MGEETLKFNLMFFPVQTCFLELINKCDDHKMSNLNTRIYKLSKLIVLALVCALFGFFTGLSFSQSSIIFIFSFSIFGSLFFWDYRLGFMFVGSSIYLFMGAVTPEEFVHYASLDVILFLISMMIVVGMMKDAGLFEWLITVLLRVKKLNGIKLYIIVMFVSAIFSSLMGEVASIMIMVMTILGICDLMEIDPVSLIISSIIATNIGSAATVLGNPVGILIASKSGLSFEDFLIHALPNSTVNLIVVICILIFWNRKYIKSISTALKYYTENESFMHLISIPSDRKTKVSIGIFLTTIFLISMHKRLEILLELHENALLLMFPILSAGIVLLYRHEKSRDYIEKEIEWMSIIFFMFLFAQAGVIQSTGIAQHFAKKILILAGSSHEHLIGLILFSSGVFSSVMDNVVAVASYTPLIKELESVSSANSNLWWALLFGACYGGNITMIGSTANIVAFGLLEKEINFKITFIQWFKIGCLIGMVNLFITYIMMTVPATLFH